MKNTHPRRRFAWPTAVLAALMAGTTAGLNPMLSTAEAQTGHEGHDHGSEPPTTGSTGDHDDHAGHDHGEIEPMAGSTSGHDDHAGHDHGDAEPVPSSANDHAGHDHGDHQEADDHTGHDDHGSEADTVVLSAAAVERYGIRTGRVESKAINGTVTAPARLGFDEEAMAHVSSLVAGRVTDIRVRLGDTVAAGDAMFSLSSPELGQLQADYLSDLSALDAAGPAVALRRNSFERAQKLFDDTQGISQTEVQQREAELNAAEVAQTAARAAAAADRNALRLHGMSESQIATLTETRELAPRFTVTAPIGGTVIDRHLTTGELVGPEDEALLTLADLTTVWALIDVPEARLAGLGIGSPVELQLGSQSDAASAVSGTVAYIAPALDPTTRTLRLRAEIENPDGRFRPGTFARATVGPAQANGDAVAAVPAAAVVTYEGASAVFVPVTGQPNAFVARPVRLGDRVGDTFPVLDGLQTGDPLVTAGTFILKAELGKAGVKHEH